MSGHADIIHRLHQLDPHRGWEPAACKDALASLDALQAENHHLADALADIASTAGSDWAGSVPGGTVAVIVGGKALAAVSGVGSGAWRPTSD